ncbi:hypothetical protein L596_009748 [Steinernema carpocapsae]|uniref:F-box domain-containing protein n=1 Tax=Steinernema carpocapsae TaxID=34508 RepID=A0A4V6A6P4_STECR|nr:hypothetical protein L596_009748 [Steinernema carpocapsae]
MHTIMNDLPYSFVDAVAHLLSEDDVEICHALSSDLWRCVAEKHVEKRVNFEADVIQTDEGLSLRTNDGVSFDRIFNSPNSKYVRLFFYYLADQSTSDTVLDPTMLEQFFAKMNRLPIVGLDHSHFIENSAFWYKLPVRGISLNDDSPQEMIRYHLFENELLEQVHVWRAVSICDVMLQLVESFYYGEMQERQSTENEIDDLEELGFVRDFRGGYERIMERIINGKPKKITFLC